MTVAGLGRIAELFVGLAVAALLGLLLLIARYYQRQSNVRSGYLIFLLPAAALLAAGIRYTTLGGQIAGDGLGDGLRLVGGVCLIGWGTYVVTLMTGNRR